MKIFELFGSVLIDNKGANRSLDETDLKNKKLADGFDKTIKGITKFGSIAAGVFASVSGVAALMVAEYSEGEQAHARLESIAKTVSKATDEEIISLKNLALEMQKLTPYAEDVIVAGQSQLLSFGLTTDQTKKLTSSLADMLAATKGVKASQDDAINAANMLGKAFSGQAGALTRAGVLLNETQENILRTGTAAQKTAALVDIMNQNYGNLSKDLRGTVAGAIEATKHSFGDILSAVGEKLIPTVVKLAEEFQKRMPDIVKNVSNFATIAEPILLILGMTIIWIAENFNALAVIISLVAYAFVSFKVINGIIFLFDNLSKVTLALAAAKKFLAIANLTASASFAALGTSLLTVLPYILIVTAAVAGLLVLFGALKKETGGQSLGGGNFSPNINQYVRSAPMIPTNQSSRTQNNYNVNVSTRDVKEFNDMAEFFNSVPRLSRGY